MPTDFSQLPGIDRLLRAELLAGWDERLAHPVRVRAARGLVEECRARLKRGEDAPCETAIAEELRGRFEQLLGGGMRSVINATGVVLHTNLGRAPFGKEILEEMAREIGYYCNLEMDLSTGDRGDRSEFVESLLKVLTDAPAALTVGNGAAAVLLALFATSRGKSVLISRGELVQIGGGFRIPDVLECSGATLVEVGTTNITTISDYENALGPQIGSVLKVHHSCFQISGHTEAVEIEALAKLSQRRGIPLIVDLGSGALREIERELGEFGVSSALSAGADLVCFSGDKLLGGPQAGIIVGKPTLIAAMRKNPLHRALRLGKTETFLLERTLKSIASGRGTPAWERLQERPERIEQRARAFITQLPEILSPKTITGKSAVGGGALPARDLPTVLIELFPTDAEKFTRALLGTRPAVVCRRENKRVFLDLRSVFPEEESRLASSISLAARGAS